MTANVTVDKVLSHLWFVNTSFRYGFFFPRQMWDKGLYSVENILRLTISKTTARFSLVITIHLRIPTIPLSKHWKYLKQVYSSTSFSTIKQQLLGNMLPATQCYVAREQFWNDIKCFNPDKEEIESRSKFEKSSAILLKESEVMT